MLSDDEILGLWSEGKAQPPARPVLGRKKVLAFARAVERGAYERAAKECELQITGSDYHFFATHGHWDHMAQAATNCAAAIRALGVSDD